MMRASLNALREVVSRNRPSRKPQFFEAPNYLAAKDDAVFADVVARANDRRSPLLRMLGRI